MLRSLFKWTNDPVIIINICIGINGSGSSSTYAKLWFRRQRLKSRRKRWWRHSEVYARRITNPNPYLIAASSNKYYSSVVIPQCLRAAQTIPKHRLSEVRKIKFENDPVTPKSDGKWGDIQFETKQKIVTKSFRRSRERWRKRQCLPTGTLEERRRRR